MFNSRTLTLTLAAMAALVQTGFAQKETPMSTAKGNITVIFKGFAQSPNDQYEVNLQASLRNDTPFKVKEVLFEFTGYDASGNNVRMCGSPGIGDGGCDFQLFTSIEPGQTLPIISPGNLAFINTSHKKVDRSEWKVKRAEYFIKYDIQSESITNEKFVISPSFSLKGIGLEFLNKSSDVIEVAWDQSVYIDEEGNSSRLIRGNVNFAEKDRPQPNTVIPPGTKLQETVFPVDRIQQEDGKWKQLPILPEVALIIDPQYLKELQAKNIEWIQHAYFPDTKKLAGKEVRVFLRLLVNDQKQNVTVTFKIANMVQ